MMPSRRGVLLILSFWLVTLGYVGYRDVWPRLFADKAPAVWIDLSDEATQTVPVRWAFYLNDDRVGTVTTQMSYEAGTDAFTFATKYRGDLKRDVFGYSVKVPEFDMTTTVNRAGELRAQKMVAAFQVKALGLSLGGKGATDAVVRDGQLVGNCRLDSDTFGTFEAPFEPAPVPEGQVLNPLQPVNRLRGVRPGMRWVIYEVNPLAEAVNGIRETVGKKFGTALLNGKPPARTSLVATVADAPEVLKLSRGEHECWVIDIRGDTGSTTVWVRVRDGHVMQQRAKLEDDTMRLERED
jgi:hypothetical protein